MGYIKINKNAFFYNLEVIIKKAGDRDKVALVLKDNAYGHGLLEIASLSSEFGIKRAVVRNLFEAKRVESFFDYILVLADMPQEITPFHFTINSLEDIKKFPKGSKVELKVDTGMHRSGILPKELKEAFLLIKKQKLDLKGVFTHYRSADELSGELFWQQKNFEDVKNESLRLCKEFGFEKPLFHSCNSAALFRLNEFIDDFARVGIAAYGYLEMDEVFDKPELKPVLSLWAKRISKRELKKGERVGYGGVFEAEKDLVLSTFDVGYADGFFRLDGTKEYILPQGYKVAGKVSMDSISVLCDEEEICIINDAKIPARFFGTITYEILVKLSPFLKREVLS